MPFRPNKRFPFSEPDSTRLWRYMNFSKFASLLQSHALHFTRVDQLQDTFEGSQSLPNLREPPQLDDSHYLGDAGKLTEEQRRNLAYLLEAPHPLDRQVVAVNCWQMNDYESTAMWQSYVLGGEGVAVQSSLGAFKSAFQATAESVTIAPVIYIDHSTDRIPRGNFLHAFLRKRKNFEHERELRALVFMPEGERGAPGPVPVEGLDVTVDLRTLIEGVRLAPGSADWFEKVVRAELDTWGLASVPLARSELDRKPPRP